MTSTSSDEPLHILALQVSNIQRIKAVALAPAEEGLTVISGEMAQGKTSVLDAIEMLLRGKDAVSQMPVRAGEESGRVEAIIGPDGKEAFKIVRKFTGGDKTYLEIRAADGAPVKSPQAFLDGLLSTISFDPMAFADPPGCKTDVARRAARIDMLLKAVKLPIDLKAHDARVEEVELERKAANKEAARISALLGDTANPETGKAVAESDTAPIDEEPLVRALAKAEAEVTETAAAAKQVAVMDGELEELRGRIESLTKRRQEAYARSTRKPEDVEPPRRALEEVRRKNEVRKTEREAGIRREEHLKALGQARQRSTKLSETLQELRDVRAKALADTPFPVKALSISEAGDVVIKTKDGNVLPFDQSSHGQRMLASFALMATTNPKLRVALVREGNNLSPAGMKQLAAIAAKHRYQVVVERIIADQPNAIIMEDGMVKGAGA